MQLWKWRYEKSIPLRAITIATGRLITDPFLIDCREYHGKMHRATVAHTSSNLKQETSIYVYVGDPSLGVLSLESKQPTAVSQCQAIHARSIFPCQDTPDVKSTFDFNITSPLPVMTSGLPIRQSSMTSHSENKLYRFHQTVPIPSYLFAIASG